MSWAIDCGRIHALDNSGLGTLRAAVPAEEAAARFPSPPRSPVNIRRASAKLNCRAGIVCFEVMGLDDHSEPEKLRGMKIGL